MGKRKKAEEGGSNWMDTYGDLVTLLLTFFVMLYSMSNLDAKKWEIFVRSIGPNSADMAQDVVINSTQGDEEDLLGTTELPAIDEENIEENTLYLALVAALNELGSDAEGVSVSEGEGYTFVVFQDSPFFDGESSVLTKQGKEVLDVFAQVIDGSSDMIGQINIMGHTAQADPNSPNSARRDRMLSSDRAAEVCIYIQEKDVIEPEKMICLSYGQHRPVASNDTSEGRAQNRRVEILLLDKDADINVMNEFYNDYSKVIYSEKSEISVDEDGFEMAEPKPEDIASGMSPIPSTDEEIPEISDVPGVSDIPEGGVVDIIE